MFVLKYQISDFYMFTCVQISICDVHSHRDVPYAIGGSKEGSRAENDGYGIYLENLEIVLDCWNNLGLSKIMHEVFNNLLEM